MSSQKGDARKCMPVRKGLESIVKILERLEISLQDIDRLRQRQQRSEGVA